MEVFVSSCKCQASVLRIGIQHRTESNRYSFVLLDYKILYCNDFLSHLFTAFPPMCCVGECTGTDWKCPDYFCSEISHDHCKKGSVCCCRYSKVYVLNMLHCDSDSIVYFFIVLTPRFHCHAINST